jgi:CO/xanthine dehydrogenase FAD-binding subunit
MRAFVPDYEMVAPGNLRAVLQLLAARPGEWRPFAGGTDLMVLLESGKLEHKKFVSLWGVKELTGIIESESAVRLGALTTYSDVLRSRVISQEFPMLAQAARETGGVATQNRGTLGGNIVNASPAADSPPVLLVYDAELELTSARGSRSMPYAGFHTAYKKTLLEPGEIVSHIRLPRPSGPSREQYRKVGTRKAQAISKVCFAGKVHIEDGLVRGARLALGSIAPLPLRCFKTESVLEGRRLTPDLITVACREMEAEISPISDIRSTELYRRRVTVNLLEAFLRSL